MYEKRNQYKFSKSNVDLPRVGNDGVNIKKGM